MKRLINWEVLLNQYIDSVRDRKFEWGVFDCCVFSAGVIQAVTGIDYMYEFRGKYDSEASSQQALESIGKGNLYKTLLSKFGKPGRNVAIYEKGDLVLYKGICGVVIGRKSLFITEAGLMLADTIKMDYIFHV